MKKTNLPTLAELLTAAIGLLSAAVSIGITGFVIWAVYRFVVAYT